jgi:hypothetical protein
MGVLLFASGRELSVAIADTDDFAPQQNQEPLVFIGMSGAAPVVVDSTGERSSAALGRGLV